jgi:hypothetical protein
MLKITLLALVLASALSSSALAGSWTGTHLGNYDYWNSDQGDSYSGTRLGNYYYWSGTDRNGNYHSGTGTRLGNYQYWNSDQD